MIRYFLLTVLFISLNTGVYSQLSGTYTIGASSDFPTLRAAVDSLNNVGLAGATTFNIKSAHTDTILSEIRIDHLSLSTSRNLLIQTEPGFSSKARVIMYQTLSNRYQYSIVSEKGYVSYKNIELNIENDRSSTGGFSMGYGSIDNCLIKNNVSTSPTAIRTFGTVSVTNCIVDNSKIGVYVNGNSNQSSAIVQNNQFMNIYQVGVEVRGSFDTISIMDNLIQGFQQGIKVQYSSNVGARRNKINTNYLPITIFSSKNVTLVNNMAIGTGKILNLYDNDSVVVDNNSFYTINTNDQTLVYESIYIAGSQSSNKKGIWFRNNIVVRKANRIGRGLIAQYVNSSGNLEQCDYNCFLTDSNLLFSTGTSASGIDTTLADWILRTKFDSNSIINDPIFFNDQDLHAQSSLINGKGIALSHVTKDIDGDARPNQPTIGADEFSIKRDDLNLFKLEDRVACNGMGEVWASVRNVGPNQVISFKVNWEVKNENSSWISQSTKTYNGLLKTGEDTTLLLGKYQIASGDTFSIKALVFHPNGQIDSRRGNDSLSIDFIERGMGGYYTIGGTNPDFNTISDATNELRIKRSCSQVIFNIRSGTYNTQMNLSYSHGGASSAAPTTFRSDPSNITMPIVGNKVSQALKITGGRNFRFEKIQFQDLDSLPQENLILVRVESWGVHFDSCKFVGAPVVKREHYGDIIAASLNSGSIRNCVFEKGNNAISVSGNKVLIDNNTIYDFFDHGMYVTGTDFIISNNKIEANGRYVQAQALDARSDGGMKIIGNRIIMDSWKGTNKWEGGISLQGYANASKPNYIMNNEVIANGGCIGVGNASHCYIVNNSCYTKYSYSCIGISCVAIGDGYHKVLNNNLESDKGYLVSISTDGVSQYITEMDYNNYFNNNGRYVIALRDGSSTYFKTISDWNKATGNGAHSVSINPAFVNFPSLKPDNVKLDNLGKPLSYLSVDIDSILRHSSTPDIGAYEFNGSKDYTSIHSNLSRLAKIECMLYPNPAKTSTTVSFEESQKWIDLKLFDSSGKLCKQISTRNATTISVDLSELSIGSYSISISTELGTTVKPLIIK